MFTVDIKQQYNNNLQRHSTSEVDGCLVTGKIAKKVAGFAMLKLYKNSFSCLKDLRKREYKLPGVLLKRFREE